ncbi:MAG: argininosuccinate lyase [Chloroflexi bacterium]|nr:argininosuccinate lyase [Chloroflexota bacterium]|tara:strand:- start:1853 stop:3241 length:1389 start_codon:yes stop_codon:yes gene_type:complete
MNKKDKDLVSIIRGSVDNSDFTKSVDFDKRLYKQDILSSQAHSLILEKLGILNEKERKKLIESLNIIKEEIESGKFVWKDEYEDLHMNIESRLNEIVGPLSGKLHTGRSRNEQISTDTRMYVKDAIEEIKELIVRLQASLLDISESNSSLIIPGYTHLQRAQPVTLGHHFLAYFHMLERDYERFVRAYHASDVLTLGSGALSGNSFQIDRQFLANELGFTKISQNSLDAVSDRDFVLDFVYASMACMIHLSKLSEELILWSSSEFSFLTIGEKFTTGSSMMPQKRNPDFAELVRGKTGRTIGSLVTISTTLKALPLSYNRDLQEDKEPLFDSFDTLRDSLQIMIGLIQSLTFDDSRINEVINDSFMIATDLADYLVKKGMPFREAYAKVSLELKTIMSTKKSFNDLELKDLKKISKLFEKDVLDLTIEDVVNSRDSIGGTSFSSVSKALKEAKILLKKKKNF